MADLFNGTYGLNPEPQEDLINSNYFMCVPFVSVATTTFNTGTGITAVTTQPLWIKVSITAGAGRAYYRGVPWCYPTDLYDPSQNGISSDSSMEIVSSWQAPWTMWCKIVGENTNSPTSPNNCTMMMFGDIDGATPAAAIDWAATRSQPVIAFGMTHANEGSDPLNHPWKLIVAKGDATAPIITRVSSGVPTGGLSGSLRRVRIDYVPKRFIRALVDGVEVARYQDSKGMNTMFDCTGAGPGAIGPTLGPGVYCGTGTGGTETNISHWGLMGWRGYSNR